MYNARQGKDRWLSTADGIGDMHLRNNLLFKLPMAAAAIFFILFCFVIPAKYSNFFAVSQKRIEVVIEDGLSARDTAKKMEEAGIVTDYKSLVKWMVKYKIDRNLRPGLYTLTPGDSMFVAKQIMDTKPQNITVTIIPGTRKSTLSKMFYGDEEEDLLALELADDGNFPDEMKNLLPKAAYDRIIFLLPETYYLVPGNNFARQLVRRASALWYERIGKTISKDTTPSDIYKLGTLASIVEGEAKAENERAVLAGIFLSRIEKHMRLQSCATIIYCWDNKGVKKSHLSYNDLKIDSPYNTYMNDGLPPGPISVPSEMSWISAISPQKTDYLFFFAKKDGTHVFSKTYKEHIKKQGELNR